jgi:cation transport regulator ChaB
MQMFKAAKAAGKGIKGKYKSKNNRKDKDHNENQAEQPAWGIFREESPYNPSDLCSMCSARVHSSVQTLLRNPQNNLRVSFGGQVRFELFLCVISCVVLCSSDRKAMVVRLQS